MSTPDPAHVDAVAAVLVDAIRAHTGLADADVMWNYSIVKAAGIEAEAILTVIDDAARAALAASLPDEALIAEFRRRAAIESQGTVLRVMLGADPEVTP